MDPFTFSILLGGAAVLALVYGGAPERVVAMLFVVAYVASLAMVSQPGEVFSRVEIGLLAVDVALAAGLVWAALRANRYWTLYVCAFQLIAVLAHLPKLIMPEILPMAYAVTQMIWSYVMIIVLIAGIVRHRQRQRHYGIYPSWNGFSSLV